MSVNVRMKVVSITEEVGYTQLEDKSVPNIKTINFDVVSTSDKSNPNFPFSFWSSGTKFPLKTINKGASDQLVIGQEYDIVITPVDLTK